MEIFNIINKRRICSSPNLVKFMDLSDQPPANSLRSHLMEKLPNIPLQLLYCRNCTTVQLSATVNPTYLFTNYVWVTGTSKTVHEYSKYFSANVLKRSRNRQPFVVEIASNDGTFLRDFAIQGCRVLGVDPARNISEIAVKEGIPTMTEFFNLETAKLIKAQKGIADIVFARNVIPHVKEVHSIISGIYELLDENGLGVIEFHYSQIILNELHYDSVYHEHLFFYSLQSLIYLLSKYGFKTFDLTRSPISGGSLVIYFSKKEKEQSTVLIAALEEEKKKKTNELDTWKNFAENSSIHAKKLKAIVLEYKAKGSVIGYGASARSSTMLNFAGLNSDLIDCIIDNNPLKHNHYTPGTNIPIISFGEGKVLFDKCAVILLLAWNFEKEIVKDLKANGYLGSVIVPLPNDIRII
ncbi:class I SAM-dependent methyltransferase [bacterium]|nr:MAG: class I SAM-dependent methyltransferase [bacterium]